METESKLDAIINQSGIHPKLAQYLKEDCFLNPDNVLDWRYHALGEGFSNSLFLLLKSGWLQVYEYCKPRDEVSKEFSYQVYHPDEVMKLKAMLNDTEKNEERNNEKL